ncbi:spore coat protein Z [Salirhabdus euzebyi]|uniref:Spore coat protein Z n=1 Tax=Salirhabdus euzebyi TaxID=394506 RepID=A0A841Q3U9_9BACI|nr:CotY/CotZ family spore coat protein [Salirhabdus euzebyi]MBB6453068.1 spore coat protein Z [Salirhabdus euzebyi]
MVCGKQFDSGNCVCDVLREIAAAQTDVIEECDVSCEQSITDLLGENETSPNDTVPVMLYCKGNCEPFKGYGVYNNTARDVVSSYYFRVKEVDEECCATLELLRQAGDPVNPSNPVEQGAAGLETTGICITVDLNCFCHVTCLPATNALR